jgi:hypothetical protein
MGATPRFMFLQWGVVALRLRCELGARAPFFFVRFQVRFRTEGTA